MTHEPAAAFLLPLLPFSPLICVNDNGGHPVGQQTERRGCGGVCAAQLCVDDRPRHQRQPLQLHPTSVGGSLQLRVGHHSQVLVSHQHNGEDVEDLAQILGRMEEIVR